MLEEYESLVGLIFACPMGDELDECMLKNIRTLPILKRIEVFESFSNDEKHELINQHKKCLSVREQQISSSN